MSHNTSVASIYDKILKDASFMERSHGAFGEPESRTYIDYDKVIELTVLECIKTIKEATEKADIEFTYMGEGVPSSSHIINIKVKFGL